MRLFFLRRLKLLAKNGDFQSIQQENQSKGHTTIPVRYYSNNSPYISGAIRISPVPESNMATDCTSQLQLENDQIKITGSRIF